MTAQADELDDFMEDAIKDALRIGDCRVVVLDGKMEMVVDFSIDMKKLKSTLTTEGKRLTKEASK